MSGAASDLLRGLPDKAALLARVKPSRQGWNARFRPPELEAVGPGEESVWDYPRPPILIPPPAPIRVLHADAVVAQSDHALEIKETAGAPVPYIPPQDVRTEWLVPNGLLSLCEWKGAAVGFDLAMPGGVRVADAAWCYPDPFDDLREGYGAIAGWFAFYPAKLACFVGDARARSQPGGFYGGWVTDRIRGPIKGAPGSQGW